MTNTRNETRDSSAGRRIPIAKIGVLNTLGELGVRGVGDRLAAIGRYDGDVEAEFVKTGYVAEGRAPDDPERRFAGVSVRLPGAPHGYVLVLFPPGSANRAAALMLDEADVEVAETSNEMAQSALTELGGIMANGFTDSWADAFDVSIDTRSPMFFNGPFGRVLRRTFSFNEDLGVYIAARLSLVAHDITADIYLFPEDETLVEILDRVELEQLTQQGDGT